MCIRDSFPPSASNPSANSSHGATPSSAAVPLPSAPAQHHRSVLAFTAFAISYPIRNSIDDVTANVAENVADTRALMRSRVSAHRMCFRNQSPNAYSDAVVHATTSVDVASDAAPPFALAIAATRRGVAARARESRANDARRDVTRAQTIRMDKQCETTDFRDARDARRARADYHCLPIRLVDAFGHSEWDAATSRGAPTRGDARGDARVAPRPTRARFSSRAVARAMAPFASRARGASRARPTSHESS